MTKEGSVLEEAIATLIESCPNLTVLATSRAPLRVRSEPEYPVPPLDVPDPARVPDLQDVVGAPAVELFVQRARAASPTFELTGHNAASVAAICSAHEGSLEHAARLWGAAEALLEEIEAIAYPHASDPLLRRDRVDAARARLDQQTWELAWAEGRAMTTEQAIAEALGGRLGAPHSAKEA